MPDSTTLTATVSTHTYTATLRGQAATDNVVVILLLRTADQPFGPLPAPHEKPPTIPVVTFDLVDSIDTVPRATNDATVVEWRCLPAGGLHRWDEYPTIVEHAATWICQQHAARPDATLFLATAMPQEIGTGLGIHATTRPDWPETLWPLMYIGRDDRFSVPHLNLGRATYG